MPMTLDFRRRLFPEIPKLAEIFGTPFHIIDESGIIDTCSRMNDAFSEVNVLVGYRNFYAVKAEPTPQVLKTVFDAGMGFDCSSVAELRLARNLGAKADDIMFTSNNTSPEEFEEALENGGCILNLDDVSLIPKVPGKFPELICFRYNPGKRRSDSGDNPIGKPHLAKYGITHDQVLPAYSKAMKRGATRFGLHTMLCSNELKSTYMIQTVKMLLEIQEMVYNELGIEFEFINMGGGFGTPYRPSQKELDIERIGRETFHLMTRFNDRMGFVPTLYTECGRYVTGPHGVLVSRIINRKDTYATYYGVDAGMQSLMRPGMYGSYHHVDILNPCGGVRSGRLHRASVVGAICENIDRLADNRLLPRSTQVGDFAVTHNTGAHAIAMCFNYNGRLRTQELMWKMTNVVSRIRRGETVEDLFRVFDFEQVSAIVSGLR